MALDGSGEEMDTETAMRVEWMKQEVASTQK
jgi:hypothetical protein